MSLSSKAFNSTLEIIFNTNSTDNGSSSANTINPGDRHNPYVGIFIKAAFGSAIFISVASFITILANTLLLVTFFIDPLKIFRNPTTYFLIGLAIVDLLTGLVQEPIYATCFMFLYFQHPLTPKCKPYMQFAPYFASCTMTISLIIVFAFTVTQYIVVASPLKYGRLVTKTKVLIGVVVVYLYTAIFSCLPLMGVPKNVKDIIQLFIHNYALIMITIITYVLLHFTMKRKMAAGNSLRNENTSREESKHNVMQANFVRLNVFLLIVLIVSFVPATVVTTIRLFMEDDLFASSSLTAQISHVIVDNLVYLKFLLDPFVYAWRIPKYRESLSKIICPKNIAREPSRKANENKLVDGENHDGGLSTVELNRSAITLLSFKNIEEAPTRHT